MSADSFEATHKQIMDFAMVLSEATPDTTPPAIAVMGALSYLAAIARSDPDLTVRTVAVLNHLADELASMPSSAPPAAH